MVLPDPAPIPTDCPGTPAESHLLALILHDHCPACGRDRVPRRWPTSDRVLIALALLGVPVLLAVLAWNLAPRP